VDFRNSLLPWLIGGVILASVDVITGSISSVLADPVRLLAGLFVTPAVFLTMGIFLNAIHGSIVRTRPFRIRFLNDSRAVNGSAFLTISLLLLTTLILLDSPSGAGIFKSTIGLGLYLVLFPCFCFFSLAAYLHRKSCVPHFFISFTTIATGIFLFTIVPIFIRENPETALRSLTGILYLSGITVLILIFCAALKWLMEYISSLPLTQKLSKNVITALALSALMVIDIILVFAVTSSADTFDKTLIDRPQLPDIILIVMDTARADRISCYEGDTRITPNIDTLADEGVLFENAVSSSPWTIPSHASLFTGCYSRTHGATWRNPNLDGELTTIAGFLNEAGYTTFGISNNPGVGPGTGFTRGFDRFIEVWRNRIKNPSLYLQSLHWLRKLYGRGDAGARITNEMISKYLDKATGRPFFVFVNYLEPHLKYHPPEPFEEKYAGRDRNVKRMRKVGFEHLYDLLAGSAIFEPEDLTVLGNLYNGEIAYLDYRIGELLRKLESLGRYDNTLIILTSDHGENLGEHNLIDHQFSVHETLLKIPLILRYPEYISAGIRVDSPVQIVDVFPTIISLLSQVTESENQLDLSKLAEQTKAQIQGIDLMDILKGNAEHEIICSEYYTPGMYLDKLREKYPGVTFSHLEGDLFSIRKGDYKLIVRSEGERILYNIRRDPREMTNLIETTPEVADTLNSLLTQWLKSLRHEPHFIEKPSLDSETKYKLESLGYIID